jgi:hypothetical protein
VQLSSIGPEVQKQADEGEKKIADLKLTVGFEL